MGKHVLIAYDPATGDPEVFGPVYTARGLEELEAEAARAGLVRPERARLTSKADLLARPY
ncbi:hypothetical protein [Planomonospora sp. ID82291]|uniref:hypothetical protein n=1 Tax=Planomonospora sp. ID82291 TaxID=2738136 RepID=UPI0018C3F96D|nr:hypothetical protein [Planomonospora sp. ID82291]MBG0818920.1 hypothetical protein [Planomonospora sp. ID82291]